MNSSTRLDIIHGYDRRGWRMTPTRGKRPYRQGWQAERATLEWLAEHFASHPAENIGVLLGGPSGWLVDVDLDHPLAVRMAAQFLPPTAAVFGRAGKPRSHWLYRVSGPVDTQQHHVSPEMGEMIVELRSTGAQTVFPGSIHISGEAIEWAEEGEPAVVAPADLSRAVARLADAVRAELGVAAESPKRNGHTPHHGQAARPAAVLERARKYIARIPPAISGHRGHDATFHVACLLVIGFGLGEADALALLAEWNATCLPPWTERELSHKVEDAMKQPGERGYLLTDRPPLDRGQSAEPKDTDRSRAEPRIVAPFVAFPTDCLPPVLARFITETAAAIDCDPAFVALPVLGVVAGAIGGTRRLVLKRGWSEPATCWTAIVSPSGTAKSVAWRAAVSPIFRHHHQQIEAYREALARHETNTLKHECDLKGWRDKLKKGDGGEPPEKPEAPPEIRFMVDDPTLQKLVPLLAANPRGLLLLPSSGELGAWMGDFNRWSGEGTVSSDALRWTATFHGDAITCDRVTSGVKYAPAAYVSIAGNIQPETLRAALGTEHLFNGLAARLLLAMPPVTAKRITDDEVSEATESAYTRLADSLLTLQPTTDQDGRPQPLFIGLRPSAKRELVAFLNALNAELADLDDPHERAAWSKIEAYAIRFALLIHLVRAHTGDGVEAGPVDVESVRRAITLTEWFRREASRVYEWRAGAVVTDASERLVAWIRQQGGTVTVRDLQRGPRRFRGSAETAETELQGLAEAGKGHWTDAPATENGGRPTRVFRLAPGGDGDTTPKTFAKTEVVSPSPGVDLLESDPEWGEV